VQTAQQAAQPTALVLRWVRVPQQARTRAALGRLLDAAEALVAERGFDQTSVADIVSRAGVSVGGFYRRFQDKDGLLQALHERFCEEARATTDVALDPANWGGATVADILRDVVAFLVQIYRERVGLLRAFLHRCVIDAEVQRRQEELFEYIADGLERLLADRMEASDHPDPKLALRFGLRTLHGALDDTIVLRTSAPVLEDQRIVVELSRMIIRYLGVAESSAAPAKATYARSSQKP
jgi:AcrR family transcriptional regulator